MQYIPLSKLKPGSSGQITQRLRELRKAAHDFMHLLIVRKSKKEGGYIILSGNLQFDYLKKHTKKLAVPCLVDESKASSMLASLLHRMRKRQLPYDVPCVKRERTSANSWSIIRTFLKREARFRHLSNRQQLSVLRLALQYKKTTVRAMTAKVDDLVKNKRA